VTDYTTADEIAAVWAEVTPELAGALHTDTYSLLRVTRVSDGRGGTTTTEASIETGRCTLMQTRAQGREGANAGGVVESIYRLDAELPITTVAKADDVLNVNGTRYQIIAVSKPGLFGPQFQYAQLERVT
jgi:hypothetical protein